MSFARSELTYLSRFIRKLIIRGRKRTGYFSTEGYQSAPNEPVQAMGIKRAQHYGFVSEPPDGTESLVLAINGGASNRVSVAEWTTDEPEIDAPGAEVLIWCRNGQRILLNKDGDVVIYPKSGRNVLLGGADANDPVVTKSTFDNFVSTFNGHAHLPGTFTAGANPVTGTSATPSSTNGNAPTRVTLAK
jgi:phage gp45-like